MGKEIDKIKEFITKIIETRECPKCNGTLKLYYGNSYFNINDAETPEEEIRCINLICEECKTGFNITDAGLLYYIKNNELVYGICVSQSDVDMIKYLIENKNPGDKQHIEIPEEITNNKLYDYLINTDCNDEDCIVEKGKSRVTNLEKFIQFNKVNRNN